jgi:hypothetical protein
MLKDPLILYYFGFPLVLLVQAIIFLDRKTFKSLFWFGLIWGSGLTTILLFIFDNLLNLVKYQHAYPFTFFNSPMLFNFGWTPAIMMFIHFLPNKKIGYAFYVYTLTFCLINAVNDEVFHQIGLLEYIHWSAFTRFIISLPYFYFMAVHYLNLKTKGVFEEV